MSMSVALNSPVPPSVVVMGVSGTGKTATGRLLAHRLGVAFLDADDLHSPDNRAKMSAGIPLTDADRLPWLTAICHWLHNRNAERAGSVVACSALKRHYRDTLRTAEPTLFFLLLTADRATLATRLSHRQDHFMPPTLLDSQLATLEPLQPGESGATLPATSPPPTLTAQAVNLLGKTAPE